MKRSFVLDFNKKIGSLIESEPFFLLEDEELYLEFVGNINDLLLVSVKNGEANKQLVVNNRSCVIPSELIVDGQLEVVVSLYNGKTVIGRCTCEPIVIIRPSVDVFEGHPKIAELENVIAKLKAEITYLKDTVSDLHNNVGKLWEIIES